MIVANREVKRLADVSRWQGLIDWSAFSEDGAYIKASGGDGGLYRDGQFSRNASLCPKPWGAYHFASKAAFNPVTEANYFCQTIKGKGWRLPPCLDWEPTGSMDGLAATQWVLAFCRQVELVLGVKPIIYTGAYVSLARTNELLSYDLWLAWYTASGRTDPDPTAIPLPGNCAPWGSNWSIWQYTSEGRLNGISGNVDRNVCSADWFNRVLGNQPAPPTQPQPPKASSMFYVKFPDGEAIWQYTRGTDGLAYFIWEQDPTAVRLSGAPVHLLASGDNDLDRLYGSAVKVGPPA